MGLNGYGLLGLSSRWKMGMVGVDFLSCGLKIWFIFCSFT